MKRRLDLEKYAPPGYDWRRELKLFVGGLSSAFGYSLMRYGPRLRHEYDSLYYISRTTGEKILREDAQMASFALIVRGCLNLFPVIALAMACFAALHYAYHRRGSRSDYTMRRLPDRWEMHRRCLTIPLCAALITLLAGIIVCLAYFGIYMLVTPEECMLGGRENQWWIFWNVIILGKDGVTLK